MCFCLDRYYQTDRKAINSVNKRIQKMTKDDERDTNNDGDDGDDDKNEDDEKATDENDEMENDDDDQNYPKQSSSPPPSSSRSESSSFNNQDRQRHIRVNHHNDDDVDLDGNKNGNVDPLGDGLGRDDDNNNNTTTTMRNLNSHINVIGTETGRTTMIRRTTPPIYRLRLDVDHDLRKRHLSVDDLWTRYRSFARRYYIQLDVADEVISRILFWLPHRHHQRSPSTTSLSSSKTAGEDDQDAATADIIDSPSSLTSSSSSYWREVMYGLLSLNRLMLSLALQQQQSQSDDSNNTNGSKSRLSSGGYGMTVQTRDEPYVPAMRIRIALTVIQSILPSILAVAEATVGRRQLSSKEEQGCDNNGDNNSLQLASSSSSSRMFESRARRTTRVKLYIEQFRFLLRMYLLCNYWRQQQRSGVEGDKSSSSSSSSLLSSTPFLGILMDGGIYYVTDQQGSEVDQQQQQQQQGMSWEEADAIARREMYVGQRTGWRQYQNINTDGDDDDNSSSNNNYYYNDNHCQNRSPLSKSNLLSRIWRVPSSLLGISKSSQIKLAEVLHVARPVLWAWFESKYSPATLDYDDDEALTVVPSSSNTNNRTLLPSSVSKLSTFVGRDRRRLLRAWILCLGMDLLSIRMLETTSKSTRTETRTNGSHRRTRGSRRTTTTTMKKTKTKKQNEDYMYEIHRRKMALFLYLLRCPVWNTVTSPVLLDDGGGMATVVLRRIPIVGRLLETVLYDWVMYYKWLALEEG